MIIVIRIISRNYPDLEEAHTIRGTLNPGKAVTVYNPAILTCQKDLSTQGVA